MPNPGLNLLVSALREAGMNIGVSEIVRLQRVFSLEPQLSPGSTRQRLKSLLAAVLVKSKEDREKFEHCYRGWLEMAEQAFLMPPEPLISTPKKSQTFRRNKTKPHRRRRLAIAGLLLCLPIAALITLYPPREIDPLPKEQTSPEINKTIPTILTTEQPTPKQIRGQFFSASVPEITVIEATPVWQGWTQMLLAIIAAATGLILWFKLRNHRYLPEPKTLPVQGGPPRVFLTPDRSNQAQLLDRHQQEQLVWGIDKFISAESSHRLDIPATIAATARNAGIPKLHFQTFKQQREVWLWIDEAADDSRIPRLAEEIETNFDQYERYADARGNKKTG